MELVLVFNITPEHRFFSKLYIKSTLSISHTIGPHGLLHLSTTAIPQSRGQGGSIGAVQATNATNSQGFFLNKHSQFVVCFLSIFVVLKYLFLTILSSLALLFGKRIRWIPYSATLKVCFLDGYTNKVWKDGNCHCGPTIGYHVQVPSS